MDKQTAIELLGGSVALAAKAIRVKPQAIYQWRDPLSQRILDRVEAAIARKKATEQPVREGLAA